MNELDHPQEWQEHLPYKSEVWFLMSAIVLLSCVALADQLDKVWIRIRRRYNRAKGR